MPLHRNEACGQKTLALKNEDVIVKENYHLSRERVSFFSQIASDESIELLNEFCFKGAGTGRIVLELPENSEAQWSPKGSYRLEQMLETIARLPNRSTPWTRKSGQGFGIYMLDNYAGLFHLRVL